MLIRRAAILGIKIYVLPLFEQSEIRGNEYRLFLPSLKVIAQAARTEKMMVCLETLLDGKELLALMEDLGEPNVAVCFDTGNRAALGQDLSSDIALLKQHIAHVHIKDKDFQGNNVLLGTGTVDFNSVISSLVGIGYSGAFTFETFRGKDPIATARFHRSFLEFFLNENAWQPD
jgi:sugar phosphate isomerase/epimerase